jgi:hypothetical protein
LRRGSISPCTIAEGFGGDFHGVSDASGVDEGNEAGATGHSIGRQRSVGVSFGKISKYLLFSHTQSSSSVSGSNSQ